MIDPKEALEMSKTLLCTKAGQVAHQLSAKKKGQTQCRRLPHEWGLGKEKTEASLPPVNLRRGCFEPATW